MSGVEALLRWRRPGFGLVCPAEFMPLMEDTGMVVRVGGWIIDEACRQIAAWNREGVRDVRVAVNVSAASSSRATSKATSARALDKHRRRAGACWSWR